MELKNEIYTVLDAAVAALQEAGHIAPGGLIVRGCSTSEVAGARIGKGSVPELGEIIAAAMLEACHKRGLNAAFQCCEHLNRSIVMEQSVLNDRRLIQVNAVPQPKAGGSGPALHGRCSPSPRWPWRSRRRPALTSATPWWACTSVLWRCRCASNTAAWDMPTWSWRTAVCPMWAAAARCMSKFGIRNLIA